MDLDQQQILLLIHEANVVNAIFTIGSDSRVDGEARKQSHYSEEQNNKAKLLHWRSTFLVA